MPTLGRGGRRGGGYGEGTNNTFQAFRKPYILTRMEFSFHLFAVQ
jgi:hypothetical protein